MLYTVNSAHEMNTEFQGSAEVTLEIKVRDFFSRRFFKESKSLLGTIFPFLNSFLPVYMSQNCASSICTANEGPVRIQCKCLVPIYVCIPRNETVHSVQPRYFQNRIIMFCQPIPTLVYLWEVYILYFQDRSVYFAAANYVDLSKEYINRSHSQTH